MHPVITNCPVCGESLSITRLECGACHTAIEGHFTMGRLGRLSRDQLDFVELLVKNRGNINNVASELKMAYNTARNRLDDIIATLGYTTASEEPRPDRRAILDRLASKEISVEDAMRMLRS